MCLDALDLSALLVFLAVLWVFLLRGLTTFTSTGLLLRFFPGRAFSSYHTLIERKSRMPQIQGSKGEAVVVYRESLLTKEMVYHGLSQRVNKMGFCHESISHSQKR
jgi:hypothetical protein